MSTSITNGKDYSPSRNYSQGQIQGVCGLLGKEPDSKSQNESNKIYVSIVRLNQIKVNSSTELLF